MVSKVPDDLTFDRRRIREVRLEHSNGSNALVGAAIGGGAGAVFGAVGPNTDLNKGASTVVGAGFGILLGGFLGSALPVRHWRIIYKN